LQRDPFVFWLQGYQSTSTGVPPKDPSPDYKLIEASEDNGYTNMQFERSTTTDGDDKDVQFGVRLHNNPSFRSQNYKGREELWATP